MWSAQRAGKEGAKAGLLLSQMTLHQACGVLGRRWLGLPHGLALAFVSSPGARGWLSL